MVRRLFLDSIHALLLRYSPALRNLYRSRFGQALFHQSGPFAPLMTRLNRQFRNQVKVLRLPVLLRLGFTERAVADLETIVTDSPTKGERLIATRELAVHFANRETEPDTRKALHYVELVLTQNNRRERESMAILKAECLDRLGRRAEALTLLESYRQQGDNVDLALANLHADDDERLSLINGVMARHRLEHIALADSARALDIDNIHVPDCPAGCTDGPLVTVLMPAWNAAGYIATALPSLLAQSWQNLEVLVVDDASTDETATLVESFAAQDKRVRLIKNADNAGPYVARNLGLAEARGEFVTVHDTDDWSHPRKIERQAKHLIDHPGAIANISFWARILPGLIFHRRGNAGFYIARNMSSLMFRREPMLEQAGYWDSVRFGGDSEHLRRLQTIFGDNAVVMLETGPLAFARQTETSLSASSRFGYPGFFMGARRAYLEAGNWWHRRTQVPYMEFPLRERPFPIPRPMAPASRATETTRRHLDVIIATEFRLTGGTITSTLEEVKAQQAIGLKTGLFPLLRYDLDPTLEWNGDLLDIVNGRTVHLLAYGEALSCDLLIVRHPPVLQEYQDYLPDIEAEHVLVIANQPPLRDYQDLDSRLYDLASCQGNVQRYFRQTATWLPIGPAMRQALAREPDMEQTIALSDDDWVNIIDVNNWSVGRPDNRKPVIGRHSRDQYTKWPDDREMLLAAYPANDDIDVRILGGADSARNVLGRIPDNWTVYPFGTVTPQAFLAGIDVFVYFTHPGWIEAFGRSPLEAMAAGVPVILPEHFKSLFQDAAIYASPYEVQTIVMQLYQDQARYQAQADIGQRFVRAHFGYEKHRERLASYVQSERLRPG